MLPTNLNFTTNSGIWWIVLICIVLCALLFLACTNCKASKTENEEDVVNGYMTNNI